MVFRVAEPGKPAFQLRPGEEGLSIFDPGAVDPPLNDTEVLAGFRASSRVVVRTKAEIEAKGMVIVPITGTHLLPPRLREAHAELRPGPTMTRQQFKNALKELE